MILFRPAQRQDIDSIYALTQRADAGLTTVPKSREDVDLLVMQTEAFLAYCDAVLAEKKALEHSVSFEDMNRVMFVAEDENKIIGISALIPRLGLDRPFYSFKRSRFTRKSQSPALKVTYETLQLTSDFDGCTELATLFLAADARGTGAGRLLSYGRMAFIQNHRSLFSDRLMADIRGWAEADKEPPFWTSMASKFIDLDFDTADRLSTAQGQFIDQLMPNVPIFLNLLPQAAVDCVGRANIGSAPAMQLLMRAGFRQTDMCDVFDAGPSLECDTDATMVARYSQKVRFDSLVPQNQKSTKALIYGGKSAQFRCVIDTADFENSLISKDIFEVIHNESVMACPLDTPISPPLNHAILALKGGQ